MQQRNVLQSEIQALTRERMNDVRSIADQGNARSAIRRDTTTCRKGKVCAAPIAVNGPTAGQLPAADAQRSVTRAAN